MDGFVSTEFEPVTEKGRTMVSRRQVKGLPVGAINQLTNEPMCGAWDHSTDSYCKREPMTNGRCGVHGGHNTARIEPLKARFAPVTRGLYGRDLNDEEANFYGQLKIGTLEQEIKLVRVQLLRALNAQENWEIHQDALNRVLTDDKGSIRPPKEIYKALIVEGYEYTKQEGINRDGEPLNQEAKKITHRRSDFKSEIRTLISLVAKLETQHNELMKSDVPDSERITQIAQDLRAFTEAARGTVPDKKE